MMSGEQVSVSVSVARDRTRNAVTMKLATNVQGGEVWGEYPPKPFGGPQWRCFFGGYFGGRTFLD